MEEVHGKLEAGHEKTFQGTGYDPIDQARRRLLDNGTTEAALKEIDSEVRNRIAAAAQFAQDCPEPDPAELWTDVLVDA